jgi:hypothetical protein
MTRKINVILSTWIPPIVETQQSYDTLTTFAVVKTVGRILVVLGDATVQLHEINQALDYLTTEGYLIKDTNSKSSAHYWGISFDSYTYEATDKFSEIVEQVKASLQRASSSSVNHYYFDRNSGQVAINSPGAVMHLEITHTDGLDNETKALLEQLKDAMARNDTSAVKKTFGYIADKGVDVALQLLTGYFFKV